LNSYICDANTKDYRYPISPFYCVALSFYLLRSAAQQIFKNPAPAYGTCLRPIFDFRIKIRRSSAATIFLFMHMLRSKRQKIKGRLALV
jgi:hypothetical protein